MNSKVVLMCISQPSDGSRAITALGDIRVAIFFSMLKLAYMAFMGDRRRFLCVPSFFAAKLLPIGTGTTGIESATAERRGASAKGGCEKSSSRNVAEKCGRTSFVARRVPTKVIMEGAGVRQFREM